MQPLGAQASPGRAAGRVGVTWREGLDWERGLGEGHTQAFLKIGLWTQLLLTSNEGISGHRCQARLTGEPEASHRLSTP